MGSDISLATRNEHLSNNPPTTEAAVPAYVADMIEVLESAIVDGAPGSRDTLDQLYDVLNAAKANLASPILTGNPRSVTPATGDNDTSIATTAWVRSRIDAVINGAPGALDTLNEIAAALNDDANAYDTLLSLVNLRATIARPDSHWQPARSNPFDQRRRYQHRDDGVRAERARCAANDN